MKLSEASPEALNALTDAELLSIVYGNCRDSGDHADVALLLGTTPPNVEVRARHAASLYREGRFSHVIPSGGVKWQVGDELQSECDYMTRILLEGGVPSTAIIPENEARTTKENMICGTLQLNRALKIQNVRSVMIVTSAEHMRRSLALAELFLPRSIRITASPATTPASVIEHDELRRLLQSELHLLKGLIDNRLIEDIEY